MFLDQQDRGGERRHRLPNDPLEFVREFVDDWDRKLVIDRLVIQGPEVNAESP